MRSDHDLGYEMMKRFLPILVAASRKQPGCRSSMSMAFLADPTNTATAAADPMVPQITRVRRRRRDAPRDWTLDIEVQEIEPAFAPGQFNMLYVFGVGEVPISMSGDPASTDAPHPYDPRGGPGYRRRSRGLRPGDTVGLRGPFGVRWPMAEAVGRDVVVVAGGLGLAPLRPALYRLLAERARYRQDHPALRHTQPGRHPVPPRT